MKLPCMRRRWVVGVVLGALLTSGVVSARQFSPEITLAINQLVTGVTPFTAFRTAASSYLNWGTTQGTNGYGLRDNAGAIQVKDSGGSWSNIQTSASTITNAPFITRTADGNLSNEFVMGTLATAIVINTTTTGVPTAYAGSSCAANTYATAISAVGAATCSAVSLTAGVSGTLPVASGGTGLASGSSGGVLYFSSTGILASTPALAANQILLGGGAGGVPTGLGTTGTTTTVLHGNAAGPPTFAAVSLTADVTGVLPAANGGIGLGTFAVGDLLYASTTTVLSRLADVAVGSYLRSGGVSTAPLWSTLILPNSAAQGELPVASAANTYTNLAVGTAGQLLRSAGAGATVTWSTLVYPNTAAQGEVPVASAANTYTNLAAGTAGQFLRSAGAGATVTWSGIILPNSATTGDLLQATSANTYANLSAVATGNALISGGVATASSWGKIGLTTHVSGTLAAANGGLGITTTTDDATIVGSGAAWVSTVLPNAPNGLAYATAGNSFSAVTAPTYTALTFTTLADSATAPTVASGFGTGASVPVANGVAAFTVNVGTGGTATDGVLTLPAATTGWICHVENRTAVAANLANQRTVQIATTTTSVTVENQTISTGAALAWTASDVLTLSCRGY